MPINQEALKKRQPQTIRLKEAPKTAPNVRGSLGQRVGEVGKNLVTGAARGAMLAAPMTIDLVQSGLEATGLPRPPLPTVTDLAERLPIVPRREDSAVQRIGEAAGAGAVFGPGAPIRSALIGMGSGVSAEAARLALPNSPVAELLASVTGGLGTAGTLTAAKRAKDISLSYLPGRARTQIDLQSRRLLGDEAFETPGLTSSTLAKAQEAEGLARDIPGFRPSIAEVSPSIQRISQLLRTQSSGIENEQVKRLLGNRQAIVGKADELGRSLGPSDLRGAAGAVRQRREQALEQFGQVMMASKESRELAVQDAMQPFRQAMGDIPDPAKLGSQIKETVTSQAKAGVEQFKQAYGQIDNTIRGSGNTAVKGLKEVESSITAVQVDDLPSKKVREAIRGFGTKQVPIRPGLTKETKTVQTEPTLRELRDIANELFFEKISEQAATVPNRNKVRLITQLQESVQKNIDEVLDAHGDDTLRELNKQYKAFRERFESKEVADVFRLAQTGTERISDVDLFNRLTSQAGEKGLEHYQNLAKAIGEEPAQALIGTALRAKITRAMKVGDNSFQPTEAKVNRFLKQHDLLLTQFPAIRRDLHNLKDTAKRAAMPLPTQSLAEFDEGLGKMILGTDPRRMVRSLLDGADPDITIADLTKMFGSKELGLRSISRPLYDELMKRGGFVGRTATTTPQIGTKEFGDVLAKNRLFLEGFYREAGHPELYEKMVKLQRAAQLIEGVPEDISRAINLPKPNIAKEGSAATARMFAVLRHVVSPAFLGAERGVRMAANLLQAFNERETQIIMNNLVHSPELITTLTSIRKAADVAKAQRSLKGWLKRNGLPITGAAATTTDG